MPAPASGPQPLLRLAVETPGLLHILSNLPKDLDEKLKYWRTHMEKLRIVEPLLTKRYHRERLQITCLADSKLESDLFTKFSGTLYEKRWFAVYDF
eukprot:8009744-Lingulodinium_polyedra.AAC.1